MRRQLIKRLFRLNFLFAALWFSHFPANADTIVLKNGRRILALSVVEEGDKVKYQTAAGELSLPRSIVDHVEHGGAIPASASAEAAGVNLAPPSVENSVTV